MTENRDVPRDLLNRLIQAVNTICNYPLNDNEQESLISYKGYIYENLKEKYTARKLFQDLAEEYLEKIQELENNPTYQKYVQIYQSHNWYHMPRKH